MLPLRRHQSTVPDRPCTDRQIFARWTPNPVYGARNQRYRRLRNAGFISSTVQPNTQPLYRFYLRRHITAVNSEIRGSLWA